MANEPRNILILAVTRMGDLLQASPTIHGMKKDFNGARVTVLVDKGFASICRGIPGIDEIYEIDVGMIVRSLQREATGIIDAYDYLSDIVEDLKSKEFDYCMNMSSSGYTALLMKMLNIEDSRGWIADDEGHRIISSPWSMLFAAYIYHANRHYNSINLVDTVRCVAGVQNHSKGLVYNIPEDVVPFADKFLEEKGYDGDSPVICLQAGASQGKRQWAPSKFATLLRILVEDKGATVVLTGSKEEKNISDAILGLYSHEKIISAVGETSLSELSSILNRADLLITGDTGPMHLSVAVKTPVVALFLASALCYETGPYSEGNIVLQPQISCSPCNPNFKCPRTDCHSQITPELVAELSILRAQTPMGEIPSIEHCLNLAPADQVAVYYSHFDDEGFLDFKVLNGNSAKNGYHKGFFPAAQRAYRTLWKEEFGITKPNSFSLRKANGRLRVFDEKMETDQGILETLNQCETGVKT